MADYPPFAPVLQVEHQAGAILLSQAERKRSGHMFKDCPARDLEPGKGKPKACKPCLDKWQDTGRLAKAHQRAFDAAWYAQAARDAQEAPVNHYEATLAHEEDMWEHAIPKVDVYEAVIDVPKPAARDHRPNKFGGKCVHCGAWVEPQAGALGKNAVGAWVVAHIDQCPTPEPKAEPKATEPLRAGAYRLADGQVVRIQMSKQGNPYAIALDAAKTYLGGGKLLAGAVRLSLDEAKGYGRATGTCCVCGAHLENPESVALGIGPICGGRQ